MQFTTASEITFAAAAVVAGGSVVSAASARLSQRLLAAFAIVLALATIGLWVAYAFHRQTPILVSAIGTMLAAVAEIGALRIVSLVERIRTVDDQIAAASSRLTEFVEGEAAERRAELERTLARARADSASMLAEQERRIADERRRGAAQTAHESAAALSEALATAQRQEENRFRSWLDDLDRQNRAVADQLARLAQRQKQLLADAEARIASNAERLEAESEQQREGLVRLREELVRAIRDAVSTGNAELETFGSERRRALHEMNERIRRRERTLAEQIEREETEAMRRIQAAFADVERRQVEQLQRVLDRAASSFSDAAAQQFSDAIRAAREDAATRLSRELDRAVQAYAREAERVLAERLTHVGDAGAQRLDKRLSQIAAGLERQRAELMTSFEERLTAGEVDLRRRMDALIADSEAERAVLEARLHELARRLESVATRA